MRIFSVYGMAFCIFFLGFGYSSLAQKENKDFFEYLKQRTAAADNDHYVSLYQVKEGRLELYVYGFVYRNRQVLCINRGDTLFMEAGLVQPNLMDMVKRNKKLLAAVKAHQLRNRNRKVLRNDAEYNRRTFLELGIKTDGFYYNHFKKASPEFIAGIKSEKLKKGYMLVNEMMDVLEQSTAKDLPH